MKGDEAMKCILRPINYLLRETAILLVDIAEHLVVWALKLDIWISTV
jgi:hypothetical protein